MYPLNVQGEKINIYEFEDAENLIKDLSEKYSADLKMVYRGGRNRNGKAFYKYPCSFDIETTTIRPGEYNYIPEDPGEAPPVAFPYLFQFCIYGEVIMVRQFSEALRIFEWLHQYFIDLKFKRLVIYVHNLAYEYHFFKNYWPVNKKGSFALDERHPVTIELNTGIIIKDSYKLSNMSLETFTKDWSVKWKKNKEIMDYEKRRTPYDKLDPQTLEYSALDVLSLSDAMTEFLKAHNTGTWSRVPTSTGFIREELKERLGIRSWKSTRAQRKYKRILENCVIDEDIYKLLKRAARGGNTHANRAYTGELLNFVCHYDITSSYPAQMVCYPEYPVGPWTKLEGDISTVELFEENGYCCLFDAVLIDPELKEGVTVPYLPTAKVLTLDGHSEYSDNGRYIKGAKKLRISILGIEWPIIKSQYNFKDVVILRGYYSRKDYLPDLIRDYVLELYAKKTELKGVAGSEIEYALAKTFVNGIYGMCYTDPIREQTTFTDTGLINTGIGDLGESLEKYQKSKAYFLCYAWGVVVAALGRVFLQKMIDAAGPNFIYADTDSIFALDPVNTDKAIRALEKELKEYHRLCGKQLIYYDIKGRPHELGGIDEEPFCCQFLTLGAKKYITIEGGELKATIAGVPKAAAPGIIKDPANFKPGLNFPGSITKKMGLWYNEDMGLDLRDKEGRPIFTASNVAMLPCDYLLDLSDDYLNCLSFEGSKIWSFKPADKNMIEDYI